MLYREAVVGEVSLRLDFDSYIQEGRPNRYPSSVCRRSTETRWRLRMFEVSNSFQFKLEVVRTRTTSCWQLERRYLQMASSNVNIFIENRRIYNHHNAAVWVLPWLIPSQPSHPCTARFHLHAHEMKISHPSIHREDIAIAHCHIIIGH